MKYLIRILPLLLFGLLGCEKVIEPKDLPEQDPRLAVNSILYPDSFITARLSLSKSILSGKPYKYLNTASCDVYENNIYVGRLDSIGNGYYKGTMKAKTNNDYTLKVTAKGYDGISAATVLPKNIALTAIERYDTTNSTISIREFSTSAGLERQIYGDLKYKFRLADDITIKNYYGILPIVTLYDSSGDSLTVISTGVYSNDNGLSGQNSYGSLLQFDDLVLVNGNEVALDVTISFNQELNFSFDLRNIKIRLALYNLSADYYKYLFTLNNQANTGASFFAEPVQVYSNVSNKMGIVAGVNINTVHIYPK